MNVEENVGFVLNEFMKLDKQVVRDRVRDALAMVGLQGVERMMTSELSGGMKKRVSLARILCMEPQMIFYDEPTTGVDPVTADAINSLIVELRHKLKECHECWGTAESRSSIRTYIVRVGLWAVWNKLLVHLRHRTGNKRTRLFPNTISTNELQKPQSK